MNTNNNTGFAIPKRLVASFVIQALIIILALCPVYTFDFDILRVLSGNEPGASDITYLNLVELSKSNPEGVEEAVAELSGKKAENVVSLALMPFNELSEKNLVIEEAPEVLGTNAGTASFSFAFVFFDVVIIGILLWCIVYGIAFAVRAVKGKISPYANYSIIPCLTLLIAQTYIFLTYNSWFNINLNVYPFPVLYVIAALVIAQIVINIVSAKKAQV